MRITALCTFRLDIKDGSLTAEYLTTVLSTLKQKLEDSSLNVPTSSCLPGRNFPVPYVLLADNGPLLTSVTKPFPGSYNKGELQTRLQVPSRSSSASYAPPGTFDVDDIATKTLVPGQWRVDGMPTGKMLRLQIVPKKLSVLAKEIREEFSGYFTSTEGHAKSVDDRRCCRQTLVPFFLNVANTCLQSRCKRGFAGATKLQVNAVFCMRERSRRPAIIAGAGEYNEYGFVEVENAFRGVMWLRLTDSEEWRSSVAYCSYKRADLVVLGDIVFFRAAVYASAAFIGYSW
ncbi:hypothetical protein PR048_019508 [Dryococelus australis]|uniref:Uncharacterized protein n=1 Tax=Dryococelus australis TaxID=614101 RepID=A0ABQ9H3R8_9NEOP|nr:hypothetical protein PR048_019508 [Dryococelus australis]